MFFAALAIIGLGGALVGLSIWLEHRRRRRLKIRRRALARIGSP